MRLPKGQSDFLMKLEFANLISVLSNATLTFRNEGRYSTLYFPLDVALEKVTFNSLTLSWPSLKRLRRGWCQCPSPLPHPRQQRFELNFCRGSISVSYLSERRINS